jgi:hypothetical protein
MAQGATPVTVEGGGGGGAELEEAPTFPEGVGMAEDAGVWAQGATPVTVTGG